VGRRWLHPSGEVDGTRRILDACLEAKVRRAGVSSVGQFLYPAAFQARDETGAFPALYNWRRHRREAEAAELSGATSASAAWTR